MGEESPDLRFTYDAITDNDKIVSLPFPGNKHGEFLVYDEYSVRIVDRKTGRFPDPRIVVPQMQNMEVYEDDVFVCAYPKCGTHWVYEMSQMIIKNTADFHSHAKESAMMEFHYAEDFNDIERPRLFNTHFTPRCMPKKMVDKKCKIIFIQRNPKDVLTSLYHHYIVALTVDKSTTFSEFLNCRLKNEEELSSNIFYYTKTWLDFISSTDQPVLLLKYEDLKKDTVKWLKKMAAFLGYQRDESLLKEIQEQCSVQKMKAVEKERKSGSIVASSEGISKLYRKGVIGDWKNHFTVAENERFDALLKEKMKDDHNKFIYE